MIEVGQVNQHHQDLVIAIRECRTCRSGTAGLGRTNGARLPLCTCHLVPV